LRLVANGQLGKASSLYSLFLHGIRLALQLEVKCQQWLAQLDIMLRLLAPLGFRQHPRTLFGLQLVATLFRCAKLSVAVPPGRLLHWLWRVANGRPGCLARCRVADGRLRLLWSLLLRLLRLLRSRRLLQRLLGLFGLAWC